MKPCFFLAVVFCVAANGGSSLDFLLDKNVTFKLPSHWIVQRQFTNRSAEVLQLLIPDPDTDDGPDSSNVGITVEPLQPGVTVERLGNSRLRSDNGSFTVLTDIPAGETWRTVLSRAQQGKTPYVVLDRFGVDAGYMVVLRISCPVIQRKDVHWMERLAADSNALIASLKIKGKNVITSEFKNEKGLLWLRDLKDPAKTFDGN